VVALLLVPPVAGTDAVLRSLLLGIPSSEGAADPWVVIAQDEDCEGPLLRARGIARHQRWPDPLVVRIVSLGGEDRSKAEHVSAVRATALVWVLRARGWTSTPLMVRLGGPSRAVAVIDLTDPSARAGR
jgi:hypothetical protein